MRLRPGLVAVALLVVLPNRPSYAQAQSASGGCRVQGVWEMVSVSTDGKEEPLAGYRQRKVVTSHHWMWIGHAAKRDTLPLATLTDSLRAYWVSGGSGTYTTAGDNYIERIDFFNDSRFLGKPVPAKCRIEGDRWYHSFTDPFDTTAAPGPYHHVTEIWRRVP